MVLKSIATFYPDIPIFVTFPRGHIFCAESIDLRENSLGNRRFLRKGKMSNQTGIILIISICAGVLLIGAMRRHLEWLLNFVLRTVLGTIAIFMINLLLQKAGMASGIGLNPITVLTCGFLGFPGLFMLYGIHFYKTM